MEQVKKDVTVLDNANEVKILGNVIKTNVSACISVGPGYIFQLQNIYMDLLSLYGVVGNLVSQAVASQGKCHWKSVIRACINLFCIGEIAIKTPRVRGLRTIKKEILKLIDAYLECADDLTRVDQHMVVPFFEAVLGDYRNSVDIARDAEVLNVLATMVNKLRVRILWDDDMFYEN